MKFENIKGSIVAMVTPYHEDGSINFEVLTELLERQIREGTDAILTLGTTGESATMTDAEDLAVAECVVQRVAGRVPVIAGAGSNDTQTAIQLTREAAACGADAVLSVTPYYNKTTQRGLIAHFNAIADCSDCPVILYNVPSRTGMSFTAQTYFELSKHPNINGAKEASGNFSLLAEAMHLCGDELNFWSGNDDQIVPLMSLGGKGVISVLSNVAPTEAHEITRLCLEGKYAEATRLQLDYLNLINALFCEVNPIPVKKAMELLGWKVGDLRLPLVELSAEHTAMLKAELDRMCCKI